MTSEAVAAWREVVVERLPSRAGILPPGVVALEHVAELDLFRRDEAQRRVVDLQVARQRPEIDPSAGRDVDRPVVRNHALDVHWRRKRVDIEPARIVDVTPRVLEHFGWPVNRLIRLSFGPFQLGGLAPGGLEEVAAKVLAEQLGTRGSAAPRNRRATSNR